MIGVDVCVVVVDILFFECVVEGVDDGLFNFWVVEILCGCYYFFDVECGGIMVFFG